jgi:hypothetical protein
LRRPVADEWDLDVGAAWGDQREQGFGGVEAERLVAQRDDVADRRPGDLHDVAHDGFVGLFGEVGDEILEVAGEG